MKKLFAFLSLTTFVVASCASIVSKSDWPVTVTSNPDDAKITIKNEQGVKIYKGKTPSTLTLKADEAYFDGLDYTVEIEKDGYEKKIMTISSQLNGWYIGNIIFGGLIGFLIVDPATGAMWKFEPTYVANLAETEKLIENGGKTVRIIELQDVPENQRGNLVKIENQ